MTGEAQSGRTESERAEREARYSRYRLQGLRGRKEGAGDRQGNEGAKANDRGEKQEM